MLDRDEDSVTGDKEDGQDENEQQGAAVRTISDPGHGDGGRPGCTRELRDGYSLDEVSTWSDALCSATSG